MTEAPPLHFRKMNGLGNDFVVFDGRTSSVVMDESKARAIADRATGIDQFRSVAGERKRGPGLQTRTP